MRNSLYFVAPNCQNTKAPKAIANDTQTTLQTSVSFRVGVCAPRFTMPMSTKSADKTTAIRAVRHARALLNRAVLAVGDRREYYIARAADCIEDAEIWAAKLREFFEVSRY